MSATPFLVAEGLVREFAAGVGVHGLSLELARGEVLALVGPSGSGKTTTLRMLAGFESPDRGRVLVEGEDVTALPPAKRRFGMVFQSYALFPHLDVGGNVAFGLEGRGLSARDVAARVAATLTLVELGGYERRRVHELSGGQQQRVALARALAPEPRVLFLDEPLSNLDVSLRERTRRELRELIRRVGITTVLVTHEQEEAFELGDRVALLRDGRLEQVGTPEELYAAPLTLATARFLGRGSTMPVQATALATGVVQAQVEGDTWSLDAASATAAGLVVGAPAQSLALFARPEALRLSPDEGVPVTVIERRFTGAVTIYTVQTPGGRGVDVAAPATAFAVGDRTRLAPSRRGAGGLHLFPADGQVTP
jgi:iron(III) transport system ATP-binding protein